MAVTKPTLPDQLPAAHALIENLHGQLQQAHWQIDQLKRQLFGPSADALAQPEPLAPEQNLLSLFPEPSAPPATEDVVLPEAREKEAPKRPARHPQPRIVETVIQRLEPEEKVCPHCGKDKCEIGCEKSERFDYIPAKIIRQEIHRPKLACACGEAGVSIAPLPPTPIEKGMASAGLLAQVTLAKYEDHLPLDRQRKQLDRLGLTLSRQTLCDWIEKVAVWLQPIVGLMKQELLAGDYLQVDETPVRVIDPDAPGRCATGYLWVAGQPKGDVIFEFHPGRGKEYAQQLLGTFQGYLQRDGYGVYGALAAQNPGLISCGCLAHARRKFIDAQLDNPVEARWFVEQIRKLYLIEKHARDEGLGAEQRWNLRQQLAPPIWAAIRQRLETWRGKLLPQSPLNKAVRYTLSEWDPLQAYLRDGRLEIDNNLTENAIRPSAVGKKNFLFIGHPDAGWRSAMIYSVIVSCKRRSIDTWAYLKDVLTRLPAATQRQLPEFLPRNWKPSADSLAS
jgi:transposase